MMRTRLARFSSEFDAIVRPLLTPLQGAASSLEETSRESPERDLLPDLHELHHQLQILVDKVADQQAFILIFGPLKSGKSTLMNALSAAYVSEVTSLPAYPCMVYLSHSPKKSFKLWRYDGKSEDISDMAALRLLIQRAHADLAVRIRSVESEGGEFDPALHLPQAIRKIDIKTPAGELAQSGAVLVDTPGLYTRMKFGYDRMTRDFRNAAACAMFVVKPDNLFLEQVFDEFNELLELFSRIFLVVNIDTTKVDLDAEGRLVPSLEQSDPLRLIEAFENLAMSAPLKQAAEDGRLRIYPIDLLRAASWRIRTANGQTPQAADDAEQHELEAERAAHEAYQGQASFEGFLKDLTDFLNSTDYLNAFLNDSVRRARTLLGDVSEVCERDSVKAMLATLVDLERELEEGRRRREALLRLSAYDWAGALADLRQRLQTQFQGRAKESEERTSAALDQALSAWFESDASLHSLLEEDLVPALDAHRTELAGFARDVLAREALDDSGGLTLPQSVKSDLLLTGMTLDQLARAAAKRLGGERDQSPIERPFSANEIPVRKRFLDWLLFRTRSAVRRNVFGPVDEPSQRVRQADKAARLGDSARRAMEQRLDVYSAPFYREVGESVPRRVLESYEKAFYRPLLTQIEERGEAIDQQLAELDQRIAEYRRVREHVRALERSAGSALHSLEGLAEEYVVEDPEPEAEFERDVWLEPAEAALEPRRLPQVEEMAREDAKKLVGPGAIEQLLEGRVGEDNGSTVAPSTNGDDASN